jgi:hypothetical protein
LKPTRQISTSRKWTRSYFRKPDPTKDPVWLADVLRTVDFLREQEMRRKQNEARLYTLKRLSKLKSTGLQGWQTTSSSGSPVYNNRTPWWALPQSLGGPSIWDLKAEKRSGVMTDNVSVVPGQRVITTTSTGGTPRVTTTSTVVQSVTAYQKITDRVYSVDGDHVRPNRHSFRTRRINYGGGFSQAGDSLNNTRIQGSQAVAFGLSGTFPDLVSYTYNRAVTDLYEKIRGDVDLSVDAFQARQAGVMINQRFKQARELFLRKAPFALVEMVKITQRLKRSNPRDWGALWLEWTYGWKPLAGSIFGAADQMVKVATSPSVRSLPVESKSSEKGNSKTTKTVNGDGSHLTKVEESIFQCRIKAHYAIPNSRLNAVAGLTSLNPVSIAWELVPYSFVADWFVDVGGYLRNMESSLLYRTDFTGGYVVDRSKKTVREFAGGGNPTYSVSASGSAETREFGRGILGSSPIPRGPTFNPKLGTSRLISAASLLSQQLHSLKHKR